MIERNDPCWCGSGRKWKKCHYPLTQQNDFKGLAAQYHKQFGIILKTPQQIQGIKLACQLAATILKATCLMAKAGVTTNQLNDFADHLHRKAVPPPLLLVMASPLFRKASARRSTK